MTSREILEKYLNFYKKKGHKQVPNVSLVPENDPTLLFVNSGMFPLVPYLSGEPHPLGKRLVNVQRAMRFAEDLDEVGDNIHTVAFHMIGNWSLGDYFKDEQLPWAYEFLVDEIGLNPKKLVATIFEGDKDAPKDEDAIQILKKIFKKYGIDAQENERIFARPKKDNWWQRGDSIGELGGPDSEVHYYIGEGSPVGKDPIENEKDFVELGNSVFMQYKKTESGWEELPQKNVDFGGGLERMAMVAQGKTDIFETDNFYPIIEKIENLSGKKYKAGETVTVAMRIIADHIRAAVFLAMDGVFPSNKDQGYVLRRIIRRMVRNGMKLGVDENISVSLVGVVCKMFSWLYPDLPTKEKEIMDLFSKEEEKFRKTLSNGQKQLEKSIDSLKESSEEDFAQLAFDLYQSLGFPEEIFIEEIKDREISLDFKKFSELYNAKFEDHQKLSREGSEQKFKGGLADHSDQVVKYHTATHLLQTALRKVLGNHVSQIGSNITGERLRFDFTHHSKLSDQELEEVGKIVSEAINNSYPVKYEMLPKQKAIDLGAVYMKSESYPDPVKVYYVGNLPKDAISMEFCGGPHVENTKDIGKLEIYKQESIGEGKQRIYAK